MKIKTIEASGSNESMQPIGLKKWRGLRLVAEITESENDEECTMELRKKLEQLLSIEIINDPGYRMDITFTTESELIDRHKMKGAPPPPTIDPKAIERIEILIDDAVSLGDLIKLEKDAITHGLRTYFDNKIKELQLKALTVQQ